MFLGQVDRELVKDCASVAGECRVQAAVTIHDDEAEDIVVFEQLVEGLCVSRAGKGGAGRGGAGRGGGSCGKKVGE